MSSFPDRSAYAGPVLDPRAAGRSFAARARFNGWIVLASWPREEVAALLPPELELVPNAQDDHPVAFILGKQTAGALFLGPFTVPTGANYHEFGMAVPFVRHRRGRYLHLFVPRMYATYFPAVWTGNVQYGFAKEMAKFERHGNIHVITAEDRTLLLHASFEATGEWCSGGGCTLPNFDAMRSAFVLPVIGCLNDRRLVSSYFDWDFREARVRPADGTVTIVAPLVAGSPARESDDLPSGTFEVDGMVWKLSWPGPCRF